MGTTTLAKARTDRQYRGSDERYTPPWLLERVTAFLGPGWFDPCPRSYGAAPAVNGLAIPWQGRVFCNPPYSRMGPWVAKFCGESFREGLLLTLAYTDTRWFQPLFDYTILFPQGRICFLDATGRAMNRPPFGSALVYRGRRQAAFARAFGDMGAIVRRSPQSVRRPDLWTPASVEEVSA